MSTFGWIMAGFCSIAILLILGLLANETMTAIGKRTAKTRLAKGDSPREIAELIIRKAEKAREADRQRREEIRNRAGQGRVDQAR